MKRKIQSVTVVSDIHVPFHDPVALKAFWRFLDLEQPDKLVLNGDIADLSSMSSHADASTITSLREEVEAVNGFLDEVSARMKPRAKVAFNEGNHCDRYARYVSKQAPNLRGMTSVPEMFRLKQRGIQWTPYGKVYPISDKIGATHGIFCGDNYARQTLIRYNHSLFVGHAHRPQSHLMSVGGSDMNSVRGVFGTGCLVPVDEIPYIKGPAGWCQGWGHCYVMPDGTFTPYLINLTQGRAVWRGEIIDGHK